MDTASVVVLNLGLVLGLTTLLWGVSIPIRDASIVDPFWGCGFVAIAWSTRRLAGADDWRGTILVTLVTLWGLRLSIYLLWRNAGRGEDRRYTAMRNRRGASFWWMSLLTVFWLQGILIWVIGMPIQLGQLATPWTEAISFLDVAGIGMFTVGFLFESIGDWQLSRFRSEHANQGKVMDRGLWRYTRHPNYFGDFCVWWGLYLVATAGGAWWTFFGPAIMSFSLLRVSGVTLLERDIGDRRPAYRRYQRATSAFFPWPPRRSDEESC